MNCAIRHDGRLIEKFPIFASMAATLLVGLLTREIRGLNVLDSTDQIFLNPHSPKPPPPRPIKIVSRAFSKGTFHEMLPCLDVSFRFGATACSMHGIEVVLAKMSFDSSARFALGTLLLQMTCCTDFFRGTIPCFDDSYAAIEESAFVLQDNNRYSLDEISWTVNNPDGTVAHTITGFGIYRRGDEFAQMHQLVLELNIDNSELTHFDSGLVVDSSQFPVISIAVERGTLCFDVLMNINAGPSQ